MMLIDSAKDLLLYFLFLFTNSKVTTTSWFPRSLPCDVSVKHDISSVVVDCSERDLTKVPKGFPSNATNITLTINHISIIPKMAFSGLNNLTEIQLQCNCLPVRLGPKDHICFSPLNIEKGAFSSLPALKSLYLDGNQISKIPQDLPQTLTLLSLEANSIFNINKETFSELQNLEIIYLGQNCYYRNPCNVSYVIANDTFSNLTSLRILSLKDNNLTHVPRNLPSSLKELDLYNNAIQWVHEDDFKSLVRLEILDLSGNCPRCYNAPFPCTPCPHNANISIPYGAFNTLKELRILRLRSNSLTTVPNAWFENTTRLKILDLSQNFLIKEIATATFLKYLIKLEEIDLSFNYQLKYYSENLNLSVHFSKLVSLKRLIIKGYVFKELNEHHLKPLFKLQNLTLLDLGTNFIKVADLQVFSKFRSLKVINLSENKISPSSTDSYLGTCRASNHYKGENFYGSPNERHYFRYDLYGRRCKSKNKEPFSRSECNNLGKTLDLSRNNIFFINPVQFENMSSLKCLNLSGNLISQTLNGSEFKHLQHLQYLDLSYNHIDLLFETAFQELIELKFLDLSNNEHYFQVEGITHRLNFIQNLPRLSKLMMNDNQIFSSATKKLESKSLNVLEFRGNQLDVMWRDGDLGFIAFFKNLYNLTRLDISKCGLGFLPPGVFEHLPPNLKELLLTDNNLKSFNWGKLHFLKSLETLDLGKNSLTTVPHELSNCTKTLQRFILTKNNIAKLTPHFLKDALFLRYLDLSYNRIQIIYPSSFPENVMNHLKVLLLNGNGFLCTCEAVWFVWWINQTSVNIPRVATDVKCGSPNVHRDHSVLSLDLESCQLNQLGVILYSITSFVILLLLVVAINSHLFYWDLWYGYHFCAARLRSPMLSENTSYDAFVAYDTKDPLVTDWILNELLINLEKRGERRFCLCLEERDWIPGEHIVDNLSQSVYKSRKTVFVLTNSYMSSGNFENTFCMANQRLIDEKADVIILVYLEKAVRTSKYLRLRKRLCRSSVLEWPNNPRAQPLFWQCLRNALKADNRKRYGKLFSEII